jgi:hypothetical protein
LLFYDKIIIVYHFGGEKVPYNELIKNFNRIREYMREFYVYGFKSRDEYNKKSARSYDNERRRIESWLGEYMGFRMTSEKKNVFISIDSRISHHNPLYKAWKTKSFTDGDITLHFILMDILNSPEVSLPIKSIWGRVYGYFNTFENPSFVDESTIRKKLNEYISEGIVVSEKRGRKVYYRRAESPEICNTDVLDFFSEVSPCGVIGSFLLDRAGEHKEHFAFKHHYITSTLDSEILCLLFDAMQEKRYVTVEKTNRHREHIYEKQVVPVHILISVQSGRQYLMAYSPDNGYFSRIRIDNILSVKSGEVCKEFDELRSRVNGMIPHMWGVSMRNGSGEALEHVEFTVRYSDDEEYIHRRLEREKRCGTVERLDGNTSRFSADVFDAHELVPWIRSFICRITALSFSDKELEAQFWNDMKRMYNLYGVEEGDSE